MSGQLLGADGRTPDAARVRRARLGCLAWLLALLGLPALACVLWWQWSTVVTIQAIAPGACWVAFQRRIDYAFPADADTSLWLARSLDDRATWHRLAPTDSVRDAQFTWVGPRHLRIATSVAPTDEFVRAVDDVTIEWR